MGHFGARKKFCKYGHEMAIVGRNKSGICNQCSKDWGMKPHVKARARQHGWKVDGIINESGGHFTHNDFNRLFQIQGGRCALCGVHQADLPRALCVDHDRATGKARGLLCMLCNRNMVGKHTLETAHKLVAYLQKAEILNPTGTENVSNESVDATATKTLLVNVGPA